MRVLLAGWSQEEIYYIAERAYRLYLQGRLREAAILFAGLIAIDPENAYCRRALASIRSDLRQSKAPSQLSVARADNLVG
jgi:hypothetical protein